MSNILTTKHLLCVANTFVCGCLQSTNLENAKRNLDSNTRELEVLKDFTTITEVQVALLMQTARRDQYYALHQALPFRVPLCYAQLSVDTRILYALWPNVRGRWI